MSKITKYQKERIARAAATKVFEKRELQWKKNDSKFAVECYNNVFPGKLRDSLVGIPEAWLRMDSCLKFNVGGWNITLRSEKPLPTPQMDYCKPLGSIDLGELCDKVQAHSQLKKTLNDEYSILYHKILSMLMGFSTFKTLREKWPEGKEFYEKFDVEPPKSTLPANTIKDINKALGL